MKKEENANVFLISRRTSAKCTTLYSREMKQYRTSSVSYSLRNRFQTLEKLTEEETVKEKWKVIEEAVTSSCQQILSQKKYTHKDWISTETLEKIDESKNRKAALSNSRTCSEKITAQAPFTEADKMVRKKIRADKRSYLDSLGVEAEEAAHHSNMRAVYANIKKALWNI